MSSHAVLIGAARDLANRADPATAGIWPRATAFLARQALESALDDLWRRRAPGLERCSARAQLLCLPAYMPGNEGLAEAVAHAWAGLSRACHHHVYELPPTWGELQRYVEVVDQLIRQVAQPGDQKSGT